MPGASRSSRFATSAVKLIVTAPGFATEEMEVAIPPRVPTHQVTVSMKLANIQSDVTVSATEQTAEAGGLTQTLSQDEIDQLPDDEEELRRMLEEIAGPGAMIRVDGFQRQAAADATRSRASWSDAMHSPRSFIRSGRAGSRSRRGPASIAGAAMQDSTFGPVSSPPATRPRAPAPSRARWCG